MNLTIQQEFERCRYAAASIVAQYRAEAPEGFDPLALGGNQPKPPKPPAPPTKDDASRTLLGQGKRKVNSGYSSTVLTSPLGDPNSASNVKTLLGQ